MKTVAAESLKKNTGFTLLEVLVALAIFAIGILGVGRMQLMSTGGNADARKSMEASEIAQGQIETLMAADYATIADSTTVISNYTVAWTIVSQGDTDGDGLNDMLTILVTVNDPSGVERSRYTFSRFQAL